MRLLVINWLRIKYLYDIPPLRVRRHALHPRAAREESADRRAAAEESRHLVGQAPGHGNVERARGLHSSPAGLRLFSAAAARRVGGREGLGKQVDHAVEAG